VHIGATWRILLNCPSATAMRFYVKLLGPLVTIKLAYRANYTNNRMTFCLLIT